MIITCDECGSVYSVAESMIGESGRMVKCFKCYHIWRVEGSIGFNSSLNRSKKLKGDNPIWFYKITALLLFLNVVFANFIFFPEIFTKIQPFKFGLEKLNIFSSEGMVLHNFELLLDDDNLVIQGMIFNSNKHIARIPDIRYSVLNENKKIIFSHVEFSDRRELKAEDNIQISSRIFHLNPQAKFIQVEIGNKLELLIR